MLFKDQLKVDVLAGLDPASVEQVVDSLLFIKNNLTDSPKVAMAGE